MKDNMFGKKKPGNMTDNERDAKMSVVEAMRKMAEDEMGGRLKGLKKVTVASDSEGGLEKGLEKAKEMISPAEEQEEEEGSDEEMASEDEPESDEASMSEEELDAKIEELMKMKEKLKQG